MTEVNYNGKEELLMADYEGISDSDLSSIYANTDFDITDAPSTYITNTQMTYALTCKRLFPEGDTYICNDEGTYKKGHIYQIKVDGETKSWEDVTPSGGGITILNATTDFPLTGDLLTSVLANPQNYAILGKRNGEVYNTLYSYSQTVNNVLYYKNNPLDNIYTNNSIGANYYGINNDGSLPSYTAPALISLDTKSITRNPSYQGNMSDIRAIALYDNTNNTYVSAEDVNKKITGNLVTEDSYIRDTLTTNQEHGLRIENFHEELGKGDYKFYNIIDISGYDCDFIQKSESQQEDYKREFMISPRYEAIQYTQSKYDGSDSKTLRIGLNSDYTAFCYNNQTLAVGTNDELVTRKDLSGVAKLIEQNTFTAQNTFTEEILANKGLTSDGDVSITNKVVKIMNNTANGDGTNKDLVTQYDADKITREVNSTTYTHTFPNKSGTFALNEDLEGKLNVAEQSLTNRVYVRKEAGEDTTLPYSYSPEGNSFAFRSPSGTLAVEAPTQEKDAVNKNYADSLQKYLSLSGEEGTLDDSQYALVTGYDNLIIQRVGLDFRRAGYPSNGTGDYIFMCDHYTKPNGSEEWVDYFITIKTDKTWTTTIKNHLQVSEQTYAPTVTLTPDSATNGTLSEDDFNNLTEHDDVKIVLNNEYYEIADNGHTPGIRSYTHTGWNGTAIQDKSINITLATKAWTLVEGKKDKFYRHYVQLTIDGKTFCYDFVSSKADKFTADTLPGMPETAMTIFTVVSSGYYSNVSGLIYRAVVDNSLKAIMHGMITSDGSNFAYLNLSAQAVTFTSDEVIEI